MINDIKPPTSNMEDQVKELFVVSQPQNWRNSVNVTPDLGLELNLNQSPNEEQSLVLKTFWNEVNLGSYAQLDFDLGLTLTDWSRTVRSAGGFLFNVQNFKNEAPVVEAAPPEPPKGDEDGVITFRTPPPNDLHLSNVLRMALACPYADIRARAACVLDLIHVKGGLIPSAAYNGPSSFVPESDWPSLEGDESIRNQQHIPEPISQFTCGAGGDDDAIVARRISGLELDLDNNSRPPEEHEGMMTDAGYTDEDEETRLIKKKARLLSEAFLSSGRVDHTIQLMAYHPDYLEIFLRTHHFLMRGDGPLPYNHRNYIAIMAAARYQCSYLMELQKREFLYQGGDPKWLRGLDSAPAKLLALYQINKIMAHRPWVLKKEDFLHLTKKAGWSLAEVVQAVVILAHFHALSSFIHGCGITPEIDFEKGHSYMDPGNFNSIRSVSEALYRSSHHEMDAATEVKDPQDNNSSAVASPSVSFAMDQPTSYFGSKILPSPSERGKQTKSILKKTEVGSSTTPTANNSNTNSNISPNSKTANNNHLLKDATHTNTLIGANNSPPKPKGLGSSVSEVEILVETMKNLSESGPIEDPEERKKRFENVAGSDDCQEGKENLLSHSLVNSSSSIPPEISPFVTDPDFIYEDFAKRGQVSELHTFRIQDYSWEEHGYSLVNRLYNEVGVYLDEKFKLASSLTYYTMGGRTQVDTTKFRTAVWNYIQCLYGIRHDDYDYGEVNQLLERPLKAYIKTVCCYPERITKTDYDNVMKEFKHSEKVHVNLMIMEAKIQAELLYALKTIMKFLI